MNIRAEGISRRFFRQGKGTNFFYAVQETDFQLPAGQLTEICGRSGSGKSTFLNMLAGLLEPTAGRVLLQAEAEWMQLPSGGEAGRILTERVSTEQTGVDLYALPDKERSRVRNRRIGVIPQGQTALQSLTVKENVMLPALLYPGENVPAGRALTERAEALLEQVGIGHLSEAHPNELSGGELRRLSIARAEILSPGILLADEPTGDLDDENTEIVLKLLREQADSGRAVLLVTHEPSAAAFADRIYVMDGGMLKRK